MRDLESEAGAAGGVNSGASPYKVAFYVPPIPDENTTPHLGPLYLAALLERDGFEPRVFDGRIDRNAFQGLLEFQPDLLGVSAVTPGLKRGLRASRELKRVRPEVRVALGGPHPTALPAMTLREPEVDFVFSGEGERGFLELCRRLREGDLSRTSLLEVPGLSFKDEDGEVVLGEQAPLLSPEELDRLPWPAFHRMDLESYFRGSQAHGIFRRGRRILPIFSTRGCPYSCNYCCRVMGKQIRPRGVDGVLAEIGHLVEAYRIDEVYFEDDNFTVDRERALAVLDRLARFRPPIHVKFANGLRADQVDREILLAMKEARVYSLSFGVESGCPATLRKMKKGLSLERVRETVHLAKSLGFLVGANCILGYPGETLEEIRESLEFFGRLPLDSMAIVNLVPFPGTEVRAACEMEGYLTEEAGDWDNYYFSIDDPIPLIETPQLSARALVKAVRSAYRRMYLRPRWAIRAARNLTPRQVVRGASVLLGIGRRRPGRDDAMCEVP